MTLWRMPSPTMKSRMRRIRIHLNELGDKSGTFINDNRVQLEVEATSGHPLPRQQGASISWARRQVSPCDRLRRPPDHFGWDSAAHGQRPARGRLARHQHRILWCRAPLFRRFRSPTPACSRPRVPSLRRLPVSRWLVPQCALPDRPSLRPFPRDRSWVTRTHDKKRRRLLGTWFDHLDPDRILGLVDVAKGFEILPTCFLYVGYLPSLAQVASPADVPLACVRNVGLTLPRLLKPRFVVGPGPSLTWPSPWHRSWRPLEAHKERRSLLAGV
jgi:hypothetical protein